MVRKWPNIQNNELDMNAAENDAVILDLKAQLHYKTTREHSFAAQNAQTKAVSFIQANKVSIPTGQVTNASAEERYLICRNERNQLKRDLSGQQDLTAQMQERIDRLEIAARRDKRELEKLRADLHAVNGPPDPEGDTVKEVAAVLKAVNHFESEKQAMQDTIDGYRDKLKDALKLVREMQGERINSAMSGTSGDAQQKVEILERRLANQLARNVELSVVQAELEHFSESRVNALAGVHSELRSVRGKEQELSISLRGLQHKQVLWTDAWEKREIDLAANHLQAQEALQAQAQAFARNETVFAQSQQQAQELIRTQAQQLRQNETENHAMALDASKRNNAEKTRLAEAQSYGKDAQQKLKAEVTAQMSTERAELRENMIKGLQDEFSTGLAPLINDARSKISSGLKLVRNPLPATFRAAAAFRSRSPSPSPSRGPSPTPMMAGFDAEE
jgi:hypothetical protein